MEFDVTLPVQALSRRRLGQALNENILFADGFESGDFSGWDIISTSGLTEHRVQQNIVHSGRFAAKLSIYPLWFLPDPGVRMAYHNRASNDPTNAQSLPDSAFYSAWYYLPRPVQTSWINLMQWKQPQIIKPNEQTRVPVLAVRLRGVDGSMMLSLRSRVDKEGVFVEYGSDLAQDDQPLPVAEWFQIRTLYEWSKSANGRVATWLTLDDGSERPLWDVRGIITEFDVPFLAYARQWTVNNYAGDVKPSPYALFVDDCKVWTE
jgi:hypothetical protein